jgi:transcriptional regulator with XRE-family HTH domain
MAVKIFSSRVDALVGEMGSFVRATFRRPDDGPEHEEAQREVTSLFFGPRFEAAEVMLAESDRLLEELRTFAAHDLLPAQKAGINAMHRSLLAATNAVMEVLIEYQLLAPELSTAERYKVIGAQLRRLRESAGMTASQLSAEIGLSKSAISTIENGRRTTTLDNIAAWAASCDHSLSVSFIRQDEAAGRSRLDSMLTAADARQLAFLADIAEIVTRRPLHGFDHEELRGVLYELLNDPNDLNRLSVALLHKHPRIRNLPGIKFDYEEWMNLVPKYPGGDPEASSGGAG